MKQNDRKYESPFDRTARLAGGAVAVAFHALLIGVSFHAGFKYLYPPPAEQGILLEFVEDEPKPIQVKTGNEPRASQATPNSEVRLAQRSEAQVQAIAENRSIETTMGDEGDVALPEPERKKEIKQRALFSSTRNRQDSVAIQVAEEVTPNLRAGHVQGNTTIGNEEGTPSAKVTGRSLVGHLPEPDYPRQVSGQVVVRILVNQYGDVTTAIPGAKGTTIQDDTIWEAAKQAALKAKFNIDAKAPATQEGTITYQFRLK